MMSGGSSRISTPTATELHAEVWRAKRGGARFALTSLTITAMDDGGCRIDVRTQRLQMDRMVSDIVVVVAVTVGLILPWIGLAVFLVGIRLLVGGLATVGATQRKALLDVLSTAFDCQRVGVVGI